jgi:hypothetical protein
MSLEEDLTKKKPSSDVDRRNKLIEAYWSTAAVKQVPEEILQSPEFLENAPPYPRLPSEVYARLTKGQRMELSRSSPALNQLRYASWLVGKTNDPALILAMASLRGQIHMTNAFRVADMVHVPLDPRKLSVSDNDGEQWRASIHQEFKLPSEKRPRFEAAKSEWSEQKNGRTPQRDRSTAGGVKKSGFSTRNKK